MDLNSGSSFHCSLFVHAVDLFLQDLASVCWDFFNYYSSRVWSSKEPSVSSVSSKAVFGTPLPHFSEDSGCHKSLDLEFVTWLPLPLVLQDAYSLVIKTH